MRVNREELLRELGWAAQFIERKVTIPVLGTMLLSVSGGTVSIRATDLAETGVTSVPCTEGDEPWAWAVPKTLIDLLRTIDCDVVDITPAEGGIAVTHPDGKARIPGITSDSFPEAPIFLPQIGITNLAWAIERTVFAISFEENRFTINGCLLEVDETGSRLVATDGHRLSVAALNVVGIGQEAKIERCIISKRGLNHAKALAGGPIMFGRNETHCVFSTGQRTILSRLINGNFPDWRRVLPKSFAATLDVTPSEWVKAIKKVSLFADERSRSIRLSVRPDGGTLYAGSIEKGECECRVSTAGLEWEAGYNWTYLNEGLRLMPDAGTALQVSRTQDPCVFSCPQWDYVVMPMRI